METGNRIKEKRLDMGYTQDELGALLGLQKSAIAKYENGRVENIKRSVVERMAIALQCSPAYLMGWQNDTTTNKVSEIVGLFNSLDITGQEKAIEFLTTLSKLHPR